MTSQEDIDIFRWTARRAAQRPWFVAADLTAYTDIHGISEDGLAEFLACPGEALPDLALCKRPDPSRPGFKAQVQRIASFVGCNEERLARLLREVDTVNAFRAAGRGEGAAEAGLLAAARDAWDEESGPSRDASDADENAEDQEPG